ncbi:hypothetical protein UR09_03760 [Candidatus Nitromaritima sp. SCGC AAA799-A02]|nr:hypothetical protein UR09_03760 [Candidatus Nitromaritima sp. SCGC AAA799-A02]
MGIPGFATSEGTDRYRGRFNEEVAEGHFRRVEELWWSSIGIGTYMGKPDSETDRLVARATAQSLNGGINVIDTAINYRRQHAEQSVGAAIRSLVESGKLKRDEMIVCTKGGFLPHPEGPRWFHREFVDRGVVGRSDLVADCHCMHPDYLAHQLDQSLRNLGLNTIDVYYAHNPETQLGSIEEDVFYHRLGAAFEMLEEAVAKKKIRYYGLATWSAFRVATSHSKHLMLARAKELARQAAGGGEDYFRFIQLPLNLEMREAFASPAQIVGDRKLSAIAAAGELGLHPVVSGSIAQGNIERLSTARKEKLGKGFSSDSQRALHITRSTPGIASALIGMKQPAHVKENLGLCSIPLVKPFNFETLF